MYFGKLMFSVIVVIGLLGACSNAEETAQSEPAVPVNDTGMPIVDEPIEVEGFAAKFFASQDWNDLMLWNEYEEMTNISITWDTVQTETLTEKRNLMISSGDYPEVLFANAFSRTDMLKYGQQGIFLPLNDYIEEYAPNFQKILDEYPSVEQAITMADGNIYGFPTIYDPEFEALRGMSPWVNQEWLDTLGLEPPETTDEFYEMLKAFKEEDPNGNGEEDEIAWGGNGIDGFINFLRGSFGLNKQGSMNLSLDFKEGTEEFRFVPATDEYKELLTYLNKLYTEGLLNQNLFTTTGPEFTADSAKGHFGVLNSIDPAELLGLDNYVGVPVLEGPSGERSFNTVSNGVGNIGMFALTDRAKNPAAMVRWMDYFTAMKGRKCSLWASKV
ncbi:extracellular solute-binding protein [Litoribacterium kuwaitense]|uniref:extracellular solute-binding protein n=1 Tax=Litoribacterium kuwaitense TaxID=1398745 RepID=UPI001FE6268B|nr:extracellular solute-binding protein [Litoribacterium kuwaitense]